ncbi:MAG: hypothetical protein ABSF99_01005 [Anaerolineales bacterium]
MKNPQKQDPDLTQPGRWKRKRMNANVLTRNLAPGHSTTPHRNHR